jgi:hypothetical protein
VFSYISPVVASFLTSLRVSAPAQTLNRILVSRNNRQSAVPQAPRALSSNPDTRHLAVLRAIPPRHSPPHYSLARWRPLSRAISADFLPVVRKCEGETNCPHQFLELPMRRAGSAISECGVGAGREPPPRKRWLAQSADLRFSALC